MLQGPNVAAMREMQAAVNLPVIASGGVTTAEDVADLAAAGLARRHRRPCAVRRHADAQRRPRRREDAGRESDLRQQSKIMNRQGRQVRQGNTRTMVLPLAFLASLAV